MKKFLTIGAYLFFVCTNHNLYAQNVVKISGNTCTGSILRANISGVAEKIEWKANGQTIALRGSSRQGVTVAGGNGPGSNANQLYYPNGVFVDNDDNIYVADASNGRVQKFTPGNPNGVTVGANLPNRPTFPVNVFVCPRTGAIYVADYFGGGVKRLTKNGKKWVTVAGQSGEIDLSRGVWVDEQGNVYTTNYGFYFNGHWGRLDGMVLKYPPNSSQWEIVAGGNGAGSALNQFSIPTSVMLDRDGNIYVADGLNDHSMDNARVMKWAPGGTQGTVVAGGNGIGHASNQCAYPGHAFADAKGNVYVSNGNIYAEIQKWAVGTGKGRIVAGGNGIGSEPDQLNGPLGIFLKGRYLYVVEVSNHRVQRFDLSEPNTISEFTARHPGTYTAVAKFEDGTTMESNSITVSACDQPVAAASQDDILKPTENRINTARAYPNPAKNIVSVDYSSKKGGTSVIEMIDIRGRIVLYRSNAAKQGLNQNSIDISQLVNGVYFIHIIKPDKTRENIELKVE